MGKSPPTATRNSVISLRGCSPIQPQCRSGSAARGSLGDRRSGRKAPADSNCADPSAGSKRRSIAERTPAGINEGRLFLRMDKSDRVISDGVSAQAVHLVQRRGRRDLALALAPHNARRTSAKLAHKGRAPSNRINYRSAMTPS